VRAQTQVCWSLDNAVEVGGMHESTRQSQLVDRLRVTIDTLARDPRVSTAATNSAIVAHHGRPRSHARLTHLGV
jgi:hypothetical protein